MYTPIAHAQQCHRPRQLAKPHACRRLNGREGSLWSPPTFSSLSDTSSEWGKAPALCMSRPNPFQISLSLVSPSADQNQYFLLSGFPAPTWFSTVSLAGRGNTPHPGVAAGTGSPRRSSLNLGKGVKGRSEASIENTASLSSPRRSHSCVSGTGHLHSTWEAVSLGL